MYRIFCVSYQNFINSFDEDSYRLKIARPLELIADVNRYKEESKQSEVFKKKLKTKDEFILDTTIHYPDKETNQVVIMCHGLTSFKDGKNSEQLKLAQALCSSGFKVVRFDWRGHGKSTGEQTDVNVESFMKDLDCIIKNETSNLQVYLYGFSFGGFAVTEYINRTKLTVRKVVLWSPALDPWGSSFNNKSTFCYPEIVEAIKTGDIDKKGYVLWKSKNFKASRIFIEQCKNYDYHKAVSSLPSNTLIIQATNDKNVDKNDNERIAKEYKINYKELEASHSLKEKIDQAIKDTVDYFIK